MHIRGMNDFRALLEHWTPAELSQDLRVPYHTAASMKRRGWIAARYWSAFVAAARSKNLPIDETMLIRFAAQRKQPEAA